MTREVRSPESLFREVQRPANQAELELLCSIVGKLPDSYISFLTVSRHVEWCLHDSGGDCLCLWDPVEIPSNNDAYQLGRYLPELLVIGSDGGGMAIGFDRSASANPELWPIVRIGFGNLDREDFILQASNFREWHVNEFRLTR